MTIQALENESWVIEIIIFFDNKINGIDDY